MRFPAKVLPILAVASALTACTTTQVGTDRLAERDPLERFNRGVYSVNRGVDKVVLKPVTKVYRAVTPPEARQGVTNFFGNLSEPFSLINNLLQGKPDRAVRNLGRFVVNTTIGVGGLFDNAKRIGIQPADEDLGQTFAAWGMNGGPYLMLPLFGPTTMRDGVGMGVAQFADPYRVCLSECGLPHGVPLALTAAQIIDVRSNMIEQGADSFLESSLDPYAAMRSAYLQRRRAAILNQEGGDAAEAAAEAAAAADAEANPIGADPAAMPDADAGATPPVAPSTAPQTPAPADPASPQPPIPAAPATPQ